ncbi:hypothetical protein [Desulfatirhabdium butyrativorans]|nr:hypothetical protein [Desulfatirhabdium butyrativorans]
MELWILGANLAKLSNDLKAMQNIPHVVVGHFQNEQFIRYV